MSEFADAARAGAFGCRGCRDRIALAWVLAYAPLVECTSELRFAARLELTFLEAMNAHLRPLARCAPEALVVSAQTLPATSSTAAGAAIPPSAVTLLNPAATGGLNRRGLR